MSSPKVQVTLEADTKKFTSGIDKAMGSLRGFLSLGALAGMARAAIELGSKITDLANRSQVSAKWLQSVGYAAKMAGSSIEDVSTAVLELSRAQIQALGGSAQDKSAFSALGISLEDLKALNAEQLFDRVAASVQKAGGSAVAMNAAIQVMGRSGRSLIGGMAEGFSEARQRAEELGLVISDETLEAMDQLGDALDTLTLGFTAFSAVVLKNMTSLNNWSHLVKMISALGKMTNLSEWIKAYARGGSVAGGAAVGAWVSGNIAEMESIVDDYQTEEDRLASERPTRAKRGGPGRVPRAKGSGSGQVPSTDALARIGIYVGGGGDVGNGLMRIQTDALNQLRAMNRKMGALVERKTHSEFDW